MVLKQVQTIKISDISITQQELIDKLKLMYKNLEESQREKDSGFINKFQGFYE